MIIDANAYLGRWGLRSRGIAGAGEFLRAMDAHGIGRALVTGTVALVTDTRDGNRLLANETARHRDRLEPVACLNPRWGIAEARACLDGHGFRVARLSPFLHNYDLADDRLLDPFMEMFRERGVIACLAVGICHDFMSRAWTIGFTPPSRPLDGLDRFLGRHPGARVVLCGFDALDAGETENRLLPLLAGHGGLFVETSCIFAPGALEMIARAAPGRVLLGTGGGILDQACAISLVSLSGLGEAEKEMVLSGNARKLLDPA